MRSTCLAARASVGLLLLAGCGGGGGGGGPAPVTAALATDQYHLTAISGPGTGVLLGDVTAAWGVAAFDGVSAYDESVSLNFDGLIFPLPLGGSSDGAYAIDADRTIHLTELGNELARGRITSDGALALLTSTIPGDGPTIRLYGRREGAHDPTPLSGTWRLVGFNHVVSVVTSREAIFGSVTLDTLGGGSLDVTVNSEGAIFSPPSIALGYYVFADGSMLLQPGGSDRFMGGLARGGDVILLAGSSLTGGDPTFLVLVREAAAPTLAALAGSWHMTALGFTPGSSEYIGLAGTATVDAAGTLTAALTQNTEGVFSVLPPVGGAWTVDGTGLVTFTTSGGESFVGRAAPGNDFLILAGGTTAASSPVMLVLLR